MISFPENLADAIFNKWDHMVAGDYIVPPCPSKILLKQLLEVCYISSISAEEARFPNFNVIATPVDESEILNFAEGAWEFENPRPLELGEMRRLAPAADLKKSAIWVVWSDLGWRIKGLVDLGTSWYRARNGLKYNFNEPKVLIVHIDRPGRLAVYQGKFHIATLADGKIEENSGLNYHLFLHDTANEALEKLSEKIDYPSHESPREFSEFEFIALWNTYAAIANTISASKHGGMLIISKSEYELDNNHLRIKYIVNSTNLQTNFTNFMNARNYLYDYISLLEDNHGVPSDIIPEAEIKSSCAYDRLVEATRFVAALSGCDGSILLSNDLKLIGFGGEIRAELENNITICEIKHEFGDQYKICDIEQFGMRHRSAVKLASQNPDFRILVISQDGPITAIWRKKDKVFIKKNIKLTNMNMSYG